MQPSGVCSARAALVAAAVVAAAVALCGAAPTEAGPWPYACTAGENITSVTGYRLAGQTWIVTGADGRLGFPVTLQALRSGATVVAMSYSDEMATANCARLAQTLGGKPAVTCASMDLSSFASVRAAVAKITASHKSIDVVLHIAATIGHPNVTADGVVGTVQVNSVSPVLINNLLKTQLAAASKPRVVHVGSANCYDPLGWPSGNQVDAAVAWATGKQPHPIPQNQYYWYSFSKFVLLQYAAELAKREPSLTSFSVNPGFFRDDPSKYANQCKPALLWTPCPQWPDQGATSTFFTAAQPGIEDQSGALIDFATKVDHSNPSLPWVQSGDTCVPRPLPPPWSEAERSQWFDAVQKLVA